MSRDPWIGDEVANDDGSCRFGLDEFATEQDAKLCGQPAAVHVLSESAVHGVVALSTCARHAVIARAAGVFLGEHAYTAACATPATLWYPDGCIALTEPGGAA